MHNLNPIVTAALGGKNAPAPKTLGTKNQGPHVMQSPSGAASSGPGNRMSPPNFQSPASTATLSRQDSLQRTGSEDTYRSESEAKPYDMQSQSAGNFAPPPRPSALSNYGGGRTPLHNSPHVGNGNYTRPELRAQTSTLSSYGSSSPYNSAVTPSQYTGTPTAKLPSFHVLTSTRVSTTDRHPCISRSRRWSVLQWHLRTDSDERCRIDLTD
jgi:hypothetical protein